MATSIFSRANESESKTISDGNNSTASIGLAIGLIIAAVAVLVVGSFFLAAWKERCNLRRALANEREIELIHRDRVLRDYHRRQAEMNATYGPAPEGHIGGGEAMGGSGFGEGEMGRRVTN